MLPRMCRIRQRLPSDTPVSIQAKLHSEWQRLGLESQVRDKRIAIGVGSRGLAALAEIVRTVVSLVIEGGGEPFIVPAMGSHGGATASGQVDVLNSLGVSEDAVGCPIRASMETVSVGELANGVAIHVDRYAYEADGLLIINRVKPHTDFHGAHESGLLKMLAIGLGKEQGAQTLHNYGIYGIRDLMPQVALTTMQAVNLLAGIATVEDGYHQVVRLEMLPPNDLVSGEQRLLDTARQLMPRLPFDDIDVLIVDWIGKEISGTGMDTNIIGRLRIPGESEPVSPRVKALVVLDVTAESHGNALGVGLADFTTRRLFEKIDFPLMTKNVITSGFLERGRIPLIFDTDAEAIDAALEHVFRSESHRRFDARVVRIRSTLELENILVSENLVSEAAQSPAFVEAEMP